MVLMTMIGRVADGLPLAASVHNDMRDEVSCVIFNYAQLIFDIVIGGFSQAETVPNIRIKQKVFFAVLNQLHHPELVLKPILTYSSKNFSY